MVTIPGILHGKFQEQRNLQAADRWVRKELDTTEYACMLSILIEKEVLLFTVCLKYCF